MPLKTYPWRVGACSKDFSRMDGDGFYPVWANTGEDAVRRARLEHPELASRHCMAVTCAKRPSRSNPNVYEAKPEPAAP